MPPVLPAPVPAVLPASAPVVDVVVEEDHAPPAPEKPKAKTERKRTISLATDDALGEKLLKSTDQLLRTAFGGEKGKFPSVVHWLSTQRKRKIENRRALLFAPGHYLWLVLGNGMAYPILSSATHETSTKVAKRWNAVIKNRHFMMSPEPVRELEIDAPCVYGTVSGTDNLYVLMHMSLMLEQKEKDSMTLHQSQGLRKLHDALLNRWSDLAILNEVIQQHFRLNEQPLSTNDFAKQLHDAIHKSSHDEASLMAIQAQFDDAQTAYKAILQKHVASVCETLGLDTNEKRFMLTAIGIPDH